jgi:hypothetical protein
MKVFRVVHGHDLLPPDGHPAGGEDFTKRVLGQHPGPGDKKGDGFFLRDLQFSSAEECKVHS